MPIAAGRQSAPIGKQASLTMSLRAPYSKPEARPKDRERRREGCPTTKKARPEALLFKLQWLDL
jgi:hypothetical protein